MLQFLFLYYYLSQINNPYKSLQLYFENIHQNTGNYYTEKENVSINTILELHEKKKLLDILKNEKIMNNTKINILNNNLQFKKIQPINFSEGGLFSDFLN